MRDPRVTPRCGRGPKGQSLQVLDRGFVLIDPPFAECHASTLAESSGGLVIAFFAGPHEGHPDTGIWLVRREGVAPWSVPRRVATGDTADNGHYPCWNPVLHREPDGPLLLFYKVGLSPRAWWGMLMQSGDGGQTWSDAQRLPDGILGPIKNKPLRLADGALLCGTSTEAIEAWSTGSSRAAGSLSDVAGLDSDEPNPHAQDVWSVFIERTEDLGRTWDRVGPLNDAGLIGAIQPTLLQHRSGHIQALCRTLQGRIAVCWSSDEGRTWGPMSFTDLPNPNSGIDAVNLNEGRALLVYNHSGIPVGHRDGPRSPLNVAISSEGMRWQPELVLEDELGEYSYPAVIQAANGRVHLTYTWRRTNIRHVVLEVH